MLLSPTLSLLVSSHCSLFLFLTLLDSCHLSLSVHGLPTSGRSCDGGMVFEGAGSFVSKSCHVFAARAIGLGSPCHGTVLHHSSTSFLIILHPPASQIQGLQGLSEGFIPVSFLNIFFYLLRIPSQRVRRYR